MLILYNRLGGSYMKIKGRLLVFITTVLLVLGSMFVSVSADDTTTNLEYVKTTYGVTTVDTINGSGDITEELYGYLNSETYNSLSSPRIIYIPNGEYKIDGNATNKNGNLYENNIVLHSHVYIVAESGATITKTGGTKSIFRTRAGENATDIVIYGGTWVNNTANQAFEINTAGKVTIDNVKIAGNSKSGNGISISNSASVNVKNSSVENNGKYGIQISGTNASLANVTINNNTNHGISVTSTKDSNGKVKKSTVLINSCSASNNGGHGISISASTVTIDKCNAGSNAGHGISISSQTTLELTNSVMSDNHQYGLSVADSKLNSQTTGSQKNKITKNYWSGVSATGKTTTIVLNKNTITNNGTHPKETEDGLVGHGIGVAESAKATINNNTITGNAECGISVFDGANISAKSNTISNNGRHGIGGRKNVYVKLTGTTVIDGNAYNGVLISNESTLVSTGTVITNSSNIGLSIVDKSKATLTSTTITGSKNSNISLTRGSDKKDSSSVELKDKNYISGCTAGNGIVAADKSTVTISGIDNKVEVNKKNGISLSKNSSLIVTGKVTLYKNNECGIYAKQATVNINGVTCKKNGKYGIGADTATKLTMNYCTMDSNKNYGINITGSGTTASIKKTTVKNNKTIGVMIKDKAKVSAFDNNTITGNGETGVLVKSSAVVSSFQKNTISGHTKYGMAFYNSTVSKVLNNNLSNPTGKNEIYVSSTKTNVKTSAVTKINTLKTSTTKVKGTAAAGAAVSITAGKKTYNGTTNAKGEYSIKYDKQKSGTTVKVTCTDASGNKFSNSIKVK